MSAPVKARPELLRVIAAARAEGRSWDEVARLPGTPSRRTLLAWNASGIIPEASDAQATALDGLRTILTDPALTTRDRIAALNGLARAEAMQEEATDAAGVHTYNVTFPTCHHDPGCLECHAEHQAALALAAAGDPSMLGEGHAGETVAKIGHLPDLEVEAPHRPPGVPA